MLRRLLSHWAAPSLKLRLNLLITAVFLLSMGFGGLLIVHNNRAAVRSEIKSSADLALGLIDATTENLSYSRFEAGEFRERLTRHIAALGQIRHVRLQVLDAAGRPLIRAPRATPERQERAPAWFVRLIAPPSVVYRRPIDVNGSLYGYVVVSTHPTDEMAEEWANMRDLFGTAAALFLFTWLLVIWAVGRALRPVDILLASFEDLERGNFDVRLPALAAPELAAISQRFNRMAQRLKETINENRYLAQHLIKVQDEERRTVARELHDNLAQYLFAIRTDAFAIGRLAGRGECAGIAELAGSLTANAAEMEGVVRKMIQRLRPLVLDELGLSDALSDLVGSWRGRHPEVSLSLEVRTRLGGLGRDIDLAVYHMVQECLLNVAKHAGATRVSIVVSRAAANGAGEGGPRGAASAPEGMLEVMVEDNGPGSSDLGGHAGVGLVGMRERLQALGGRLEIGGGGEHGFRVVAHIPLEPGREAMRA